MYEFVASDRAFIAVLVVCVYSQAPKLKVFFVCIEPLAAPIDCQKLIRYTPTFPETKSGAALAVMPVTKKSKRGHKPRIDCVSTPVKRALCMNSSLSASAAASVEEPNRSICTWRSSLEVFSV